MPRKRTPPRSSKRGIRGATSRQTDDKSRGKEAVRGDMVEPHAADVGAHLDYEWVLQFQDLVRDRKMMAALKLFRGQPDVLGSWPLKGSYTLPLLESAARLLDRNRDHIENLSKRIEEFRNAFHFGQLLFEDATRLKLAEAIISFHREPLIEESIEPLKQIRTMADDCGNDDLRAMSRYYLARSLYRIAKYQEAKDVISEAEALVPNAPAIPSIKMVKIWILFNEESVDEADSALRAVEKAIKRMKDYIEDQNLTTLRGRFARQRGNFSAAVDAAREAIGIFEDNNDSTHRLLARAHVHKAFALLLQAQEKNLRANDPEFDLMKKEAFDSFREAEKICGKDHKRVLDRVYYFRGSWNFYLGKIKVAKPEAEAAYQAAEEVSDYVIMAHARILQCQCARDISDRPEAQRLALEAKKHAEKTDNRRVHARAHIWVGITQADPPLNNYKVARSNLESARNLLRPTDRDYLPRECTLLESLIADGHKVINAIVLPELMVDDVLNEGSLDRTLNRLAAPICEAVYKRVGAIKLAANRLGIGRGRFKVLCPHFKDTSRTSGPSDQ